MAHPWNVGMNPEQLALIAHHEGPCVGLATAGSGKTRAGVHRVARMIYDGVDAERILFVTFSKKAADEMNSRLEDLGINTARVGTWHSLCLQILREDATTWSGWQIEEEGRNPRKWALKDAIGFKGLKWAADLGKLMSFVTICKANLWTWESPEAMDLARVRFGTMRDFDGRPAYQLALKAFEMSQATIETKGILTFDDFLTYTARHLRDESARRRWGGKWDFIIQDEAQDANRAQCEIAHMLAEVHRNYMLIGDPAQSIYGFRGSTPEYISNFEATWKATSVIMNRNYRSGKSIVRVANDIIRPAATRLPVDMIAERDFEGQVKIVAAQNLEAESAEFASWIETHREQSGKYSDMTCLFRLNAQSRALEEELLKKRIPYKIIGGTSFYDRKEVKDLLGYLRVGAQMDTEGDAVKRCINAPFRFLGAAFVDRLVQAGSPGCDWTEIVDEVAEQAGVQSRQRTSAREWVRLIREVTETINAGQIEKDSESPDPEIIATSKPSAILTRLVTSTNYIAFLEKEEGEESIESSAGANVRELIRVADRFQTTKDLLDYIEKNQKASKKNKRDKQGDRVLLMSIHRSKGLEWPHVWVVGCNEMILPHRKGDLEEERRLMYVAATRARDSLTLSYVGEMAMRSGVAQSRPSRFLVDAGLVPGAASAAE